ncbi:DUF6355 family natural product biosynthesis protein [Allokutzneria albata]|uniref:Uncharacterized protein n=1 Tax=Allokutzneria albata TaxID=211114 RepID=A0A1H0DEG9_ALLAB|nr:DUF6355 family natural product biosynthesis protein [Allokutzneria albata]SDN68563.1 hypothetical protein SAMN04489726_7762 [Allokutzneria albata]
MSRLTTALTIGALAIGSAFTSIPANASPTPQECGGYKKGDEVRYRHCTSEGTSVKVRARFLVTGVHIQCVGPNEDVYFGDAGFVIEMPAYTGQLC